jgi:hypothetical protein
MYKMIESHTNIVTTLNKDFSWVEKWLARKNRYIEHLGSIVQFDKFYEQLVVEICRHNSFDESFSTEISNTSEKLAKKRSIESSERQDFLEKCGKFLPPIFLARLPALTDKSANFNINIFNEPKIPLPKLHTAQENHQDKDQSSIGSSGASLAHVSDSVLDEIRNRLAEQQNESLMESFSKERYRQSLIDNELLLQYIANQRAIADHPQVFGIHLLSIF